MTSVSTYHSRLTTRRLLISVQNADEARLAFQCGVPWVDLKNPAGGSLGQPSRAIRQEFLNVASEFTCSRISVALGEWQEVLWHEVAEWLDDFAVAKFGLAGQPVVDHSIIEQLAPHQGKVVPALYADWQRAHSPAPETVLELAIAINAPYLLIDTCIKDGRGLFQWMTVAQLRDLQQAAQVFGIGLVLAGSLRTSDWCMLEQLEHLTVGVRGAVCTTLADRTSNLSAEAIGQWLRWTESPSASQLI